MSRCGKKVRESDLFGIPVQLNIEKQGTHNTFVGGCCSIIMLVVLLSFVIG